MDFSPKTNRGRGFKVMIKTDEGELKCTVCGHSQEIAFWQSINATLDPDLRTRLFDGETKGGLNAFEDMDRAMSFILDYCLQYFIRYWKE